MKPFLCLSRTSLRAAAGAATAAAGCSSTSTCTTTTFTCAVRWQTQTPRSFGGAGAGAGAGAGRGRASNMYVAPAKVYQSTNKTNDGELSFGTRVAMRDDSIILTDIFKHLPPQGAISIKSLFSSLDADVQEALSERHGGLRSFVEQRKQIFTVRAHPTDGVLYVVGNPLVAQQYATRDIQLKTMRQMMGLAKDGSVIATQATGQRRPGGSFGARGRGGSYSSSGGSGSSSGGGRGGGGGGGYGRGNYRDNAGGGEGRGDGQGQRRYQRDNNSGGGGDRRSYGSGNRQGFENTNSGPASRPRSTMGSNQRSFGTRNG